MLACRTGVMRGNNCMREAEIRFSTVSYLLLCRCKKQQHQLCMTSLLDIVQCGCADALTAALHARRWAEGSPGASLKSMLAGIIADAAVPQAGSSPPQLTAGAHTLLAWPIPLP